MYSHRPPAGASPPSSAADRGSYFSQDTIAALASAAGGAIRVLRVSGPRSFEIAMRLTRTDRLPDPRQLSRASLVDAEGRPLDDALWVRFLAPRSYTGEDAVEFHLHGGEIVGTSVLEAVLEAGARQSLPGEFSFRAVRNGKLTLQQAQAVSDLIESTSSAGAELALEKLSGAQNRWLAELGQELRQLAMLSEAGIDFSDQDIEEVSLPRLIARLAGLQAKLEGLRRSFSRGDRLQHGIRTTFVGAPNAGKSSLFNALLGEDRSIVSAEAGTTRDVVHELLILRGAQGRFTLRLEDTAGLREGAGTLEAQGIERTLKSSRSADLLLFLLDPSNPTALPPIQVASHQRAILVITKYDTLSPIQREGLGSLAAQAFPGVPWVACSSLTGEGLDTVVQELETLCQEWISRPRGEFLLTRVDHLRAVEGALSHLERANRASEAAFLASDLKQAMASLAPLIGETVPDDILGLIFSEFCIGK